MAHLGFYKDFRKFTAFVIVKTMRDYVHKWIPGLKLMSIIPITRTHVIKFSQKFGWQPIGIIPKSVKINDNFVDQVILLEK